MNNHRSEPEPGGDIQGHEGDVPGENTNRGMNRTTPQLSAGEACQTLAATGHGFTRDVHLLRPVSELAQMLVRSAAAGANFQRRVSELEWLRGRRQCSRGVTRSFSWLTTSSRAATGATWAARRPSSRRTRPGSGLACPISARKLTTSSMT